MKGSEALAEAAIQAGCKLYFGYPITPQTELSEYMASRLPKIEGGCFLQAESEIAAINMVYGAAGTAHRSLTSSSSPGISLKQEGISYCAAAELPVVYINVMRAGPGLGTIVPSQTDYFQSTRGGGNGGYRTLALSPSSVQEACDLLQLAFDLSEKYRQPILLLCDAIISQMMEPVEIKTPAPKEYDISWAARGWTKGSSRPKAIINPRSKPGLELRLTEKYARMSREEVRVEETGLNDAEFVIAAYGTVARIAKNAIKTLAGQGIKVGLIRPITLFPFPYETFRVCAERESVRSFISVEISEGQMIEDVRLGVNGKKPVEFQGWLDLTLPTPAQLVEYVVKLKEGK
jgi:2-oxoglutarate ferredoxin oxidoreductase subunit alpha